MPAGPAKITTQVLLALVSLAGAFVSYSVYAHDRAARTPAERFAQRYQLPLRRPDIVDSLKYAPSGDFATDLVADATLRDVVVPTNLNGLSPSVRAAWLDAVSRYDEQMIGATGLLLDALGLRPGWPYHAGLLGQITFTRESRSLSPELVRNPGRWTTPLYCAAAAAASDEVLWQSLALGYLQTWPELRPLHSKTSSIVFRNAFSDVAFLRAAFGSALAITGKGAVLPALPDSPAALREAFLQLHSAGDIASAWPLHRRWDAAEWADRESDLRLIERAAKRGDVESVRGLVSAWTSAHSVWDYDSPAAHAQAFRVLGLWPAGLRGNWMSDPRANVVRYLLSRRGTATSPALLNAIDGIDHVPGPVSAECELIAGDFGESWRVANAAPDFGVSNDWTGYLFTAVRHLTSSGRDATAKSVFSHLPAAARGGCTSETMRALIEKKPASEELPSTEETLLIDTPLSLCAMSGRKARYVMPSVQRLVVVDVLYDGARRLSAMLQPAVSQRVELNHSPGSHTLVIRLAAR